MPRPRKTTRPAIVHVYVDKRGRWRWNITAPNGDQIAREADADGFTRRDNAITQLDVFLTYVAAPLAYVYDPEPWDPMEPRRGRPRKTDPRPPKKRLTERQSPARRIAKVET